MNFWKVLGGFVVVVVVVGAIQGALSGEESPRATSAAVTSSAAAVATERQVTPTPAVCIPVTDSLLSDIAVGLTVTGGGGLSRGYAVRSPDHGQVWYVAAEITGAAMDGTVGIWATNRSPVTNSPGLIFAVDVMANEFSDWGDGRRTDAAFSASDRGAVDAKRCVDQRP